MGGDSEDGQQVNKFKVNPIKKKDIMRDTLNKILILVDRKTDQLFICIRRKINNSDTRIRD